MPEEVEASGAPPTPKWIVTFTDLMSLLLTFFILLLTFSTPRVEKLFDLRGSIRDSFGIISDNRDDRDSFVPPSELRIGRDQINPYAPSIRPQFRPLEEHEPNKDILRLKDQSGEELLVDRIEEGYRIRIEGAIYFDNGSERMTSESYSKLAKVAKAVEFMPFHLVVVAYTGGQELPELRRLGIRANDLAFRRSAHVASRLVEFHAVDPLVLGIAGYGPNANDKERGRVEFVLIDKRRFLETQ